MFSLNISDGWRKSRLSAIRDGIRHQTTHVLAEARHPEEVPTIFNAPDYLAARS